MKPQNSCTTCKYFSLNADHEGLIKIPKGALFKKTEDGLFIPIDPKTKYLFRKKNVIALRDTGTFAPIENSDILKILYEIEK